MTRSLLLLALLGTVAGCTDNRTTVAIAGRAAPSDTTGVCAFSADGEFQLGPGSLALGGLGYRAVLYVDNTSIDPTGNPPGTGPAANAWRATAARTRLNPSDYTSNYPGTLLPVQGENRLPLDGITISPGGRAPVFVDMLGPALAAVAAAAGEGTVVLGITLEGQTLGGMRVESGEFYFPIQLCTLGSSCPLPFCKTSEVVASCFGAWQDPYFCLDPG